MASQVQCICPSCGMEYKANAARVRRGRHLYCSRECSYRARGQGSKERAKLRRSLDPVRECTMCGKSFVAKYGKEQRRCSRKCFHASRVGVPKPHPMSARMIALGEEGRKVLRSQAALKNWATRRAKGLVYPESFRAECARRACQRVNKGFSVSIFERKVAEVLRNLGFTLCTSVPIRDKGGKYVAVFDIVIPSRNIVLECHGSYWHGGRWSWETPTAAQAKNLTHEEAKLNLTRDAGWSWRTVFEQDFRKDPYGACLAAVR